MSHIILIRMHSGDLITIEDQENDRIFEFDSVEEANDWLQGSALISQEWEIIEVEV